MYSIYEEVYKINEDEEILNYLSHWINLHNKCLKAGRRNFLLILVQVMCTYKQVTYSHNVVALYLRISSAASHAHFPVALSAFIGEKIDYARRELQQQRQKQKIQRHYNI